MSREFQSPDATKKAAVEATLNKFRALAARIKNELCNKKLLAMACIAAMLLTSVRAQALDVYSGEQVLQLCAPMDHISRPVCTGYFQGLAEATQDARNLQGEERDICLPNLPIQAIVNATYDELKTVSPQVLKGSMSAGHLIRIIWLRKWPCKK